MAEIFTPQQRAAIEADNRELLVSAAAGSGKTRVLVERIIKRIREKKLDVSRLLVVTFTTAAAAEMRGRLEKALTELVAEDPDYAEQLRKLDSANISTLHSFCGKMIRQYFQEADIDPAARVLDGPNEDILLEQALDEALEAAFEKQSEDFVYLQKRFEEKTIIAMAKDLYRFLMAQAEPWEWLKNQAETVYTAENIKDSPAVAALLNEAGIKLSTSRSFVSQMEAMMAEPDAIPAFEEYIQSYFELLDRAEEAAAAGLEAFRATVSGAIFKKLPTVSGKKYTEGNIAWKDRFKKLNDAFKKGFLDTGDMFADTDDVMVEDMNAVQPCVRALYELLTDFENRFTEKKQAVFGLTFTDMEHKMKKILDNPAIRDEIAGRFSLISVDECQDISDIQESILQSLHNENNRIFYVGDVKQSIYRFRLANPTLFMRKMAEYRADEDAEKRKITLQMNFRSHSDILDGVNQVFRGAMRSEVTELDYDPDAELNYPEKSAEPSPIELYVLKKKKKDEAEEPGNGDDDGASEAELEEAEIEATLIAKRINQLHGTMFRTRRGEERAAKFSDMAILMPTAKGKSEKVLKILAANGIPCYSEADEGVFEMPEVKQIMALCAVLDNPMQDIPFLSILKLPCFRLKEELLGKIRLHAGPGEETYYQAFRAYAESDEKEAEIARNVLEKLAEWRFLAQNTYLSRLLWALCRETGLYAACGVLENGDARQANLLLLCQKATEFESFNDGSLSGFLSFSDKIRKAGGGDGARVLSENADVVRIMTVHKSKGLEFPFVFVMGLGGTFGGRRNESGLTLHEKIGIGISNINPDTRVKRETMLQKAAKAAKKREEKAEKLRMLYVAMTRPEYKLFLYGTVPGVAPSWGMENGAARAESASCFLDWVCQAVSDLPEGNILQTLDTVEWKTASAGDNPWEVHIRPEVSAPDEIMLCAPDVLRQVLIPKNIDISSLFYTPPTVEASPLKTSVTSFVRGQEENGEEEDAPMKARPMPAPARMTLSDLPALPRFMMEEQEQPMTAAERGTLTHKVLGLIDYALLPEPVTEESLAKAIGPLTENGILSAEEAALLNHRWLLAFLNSPLGLRARNSELCRREWAFTMRLPGHENTLLQGVLDLCFEEEGQWVLCDYKTDRVDDPAELVQRYAPQLKLYREALVRVTGMPVKEIYLFPLRLGQSVPVEG